MGKINQRWTISLFKRWSTWS